MTPNRPLRGSCHCGRNLYVVQFPQTRDPDPSLTARVVFHHHGPSQRTILGTPLPAYLRVPLAWYTSQTVPRRADETRVQIRRVYHLHDEDEDDNDNNNDGGGGGGGGVEGSNADATADPSSSSSSSSSSNLGRGSNVKKSSNAAAYEVRHFCGFCGTPLAYWREQPPGEGDFIQLALGSLLPSDLRDLEEFGVLLPTPPSESPPSAPGSPRLPEAEDAAGDAVGVVGGLPWFDELVEGSRLGRMRRSGGAGTAAAGGEGRRTTVRVAWEVTEWTEGEDAAAAAAAAAAASGESPRKRKLEEVTGGSGRPVEMEGIER
ncbi:hypothetical protein VTJ83DRAFT_1221 [Remersonia thermophila]|uniref:CENP-V/GFA domain-containing protein n=1 Tax=Remersonia thermophila TaxID=72144 RepID=A0ABR4DND6_9PEZI